jgi:accessory gene regulator B
MVMMMNFYNILTNKVMNFVSENYVLEEQQIDIIKYGLQVIFINLFKMLGLLICAYFLGIFKEVFIFVLCFACIRVFAAGVHASSSFACNLVNFLIFIGGSYISIHFTLNLNVLLVFFLISILIIFFFAPADTKEKPIINKKLRKNLKFKSLIMVSILLLCTLFVPNQVFKNIISYAVFNASICLTPFSYKLLGKEYNYYEKLKKDY